MGTHAKIPAREKAPRTRWPTRIGKRLAQVEDDAVPREIVERDERERWIKELYKLLKVGAVPALVYLTPEAGAEVTRPHCKRSACWDLAHAREDMGKGSTVLAEHIPDLLAMHVACYLGRAMWKADNYHQHLQVSAAHGELSRNRETCTSLINFVSPVRSRTPWRK